MTMCQLGTDCPTAIFLEADLITDRRSTDLDPNFPTDFTWVGDHDHESSKHLVEHLPDDLK